MKHKRVRTWSIAAAPTVAGACSISAVFTWIAESGSSWLKRQLAAHTEVWEKEGIPDCCAKARRRREIQWVAAGEGMPDAGTGVPPPPSKDQLQRIYTEPGYLTESFQEALKHKAGAIVSVHEQSSSIPARLQRPPSVQGGDGAAPAHPGPA